MTAEQTLDILLEAIVDTNPDDLAAAIMLLAGIVITIGVISLIGYLVTALGFSKIFKKAGEKGWKAFIPIFNVYTRFKIAWNVKSFWIWFLAMAVAYCAPYLGQNAVISVLTLAAGIVGIAFTIKLYVNFAKAFGKGVGTALLLYFFPFIMSLVLGFGKAEYVRNPLNPEM